MRLKSFFILIFIIFFNVFNLYSKNVILNKDVKKSDSYIKSLLNNDNHFNSWTVSFNTGLPILYSSDLRSFTKDFKGWGFDFQIPITKQLNHVFGLQLLTQVGKTVQFTNNQRGARLQTGDYLIGTTKYFASSLILDLNLTNILRPDIISDIYKWSLHSYFGPGLIYYKVHLTSHNGRKLFGTDKKSYDDVISIFDGLDSLFFQGGLGLKYKINNNLDSEIKGMWVFTGDETFDGSGPGNFSDSRMFVADIKPGTNDSFLTISLGTTYTFGDSCYESLFWHNPMKKIYNLFHVISVLSDKIDKYDENHNLFKINNYNSIDNININYNKRYIIDQNKKFTKDDLYFLLKYNLFNKYINLYDKLIENDNKYVNQKFFNVNKGKSVLKKNRCHKKLTCYNKKKTNYRIRKQKKCY